MKKHKQIPLKEAQRGDMICIGVNTHKVLSNYPDHERITFDGWVGKEVTWTYKRFHQCNAWLGIYRDMSLPARLKRWLIKFVMGL